MNIKNYKDYACFDYKSVTCPHHKLGDVVFSTEQNEVGVIIQIHEEGEYRTDMFGNCSLSEIRMATEEEIKKHRPSIKEEGDWSLTKAYSDIEEVREYMRLRSNEDILCIKQKLVYKLKDALTILEKHIPEK